MIVVAIDPGANGGIAINRNWELLNPKEPAAYKMPATDGDIVAFFRNVSEKSVSAKEDVVLFLEHVSGYAGVGQPGSSMCNFGRTFWGSMYAAMTLKWRVELIKPQKWQKWVSIGTKGTRSATEWKNRLKAEAQRRFPDIHVTLDTADALLLLDYAVNHIPGEETK